MLEWSRCSARDPSNRCVASGENAKLTELLHHVKVISISDDIASARDNNEHRKHAGMHFSGVSL
jgi:hypothetical protein